MDKLEKRIIEMIPETDERVTASELYSRGYEPKRQTMMKRIEDVTIHYREGTNGLFEFAAVVRDRKVVAGHGEAR